MSVDLSSFSLLGYPKTGNTWIHHVIVCALNINWFQIHHSHGMPTFNDDPFDKAVYDFSSHFSRKKLIVLSRHVGDTLVSLYMHNVFREKHPLFHGTVDDMLVDPIYGIDKFIRFHIVLAEWVDRYSSTVDTKVFSYEECMDDSHRLYDLLNFIGLHDESTIRQAIQASSFDMMKKRESEGLYKGLSTLDRSPHWMETNNTFKVRDGKVGDYVNHFSKESLLYIDQRMHEIPTIFR